MFPRSKTFSVSIHILPHLYNFGCTSVFTLTISATREYPGDVIIMVKMLSMKHWTLLTLEGCHLGYTAEGEVLGSWGCCGDWNCCEHHNLCYKWLHAIVRNAYCVNLAVCNDLLPRMMIRVKCCDRHFRVQNFPCWIWQHYLSKFMHYANEYIVYYTLTYSVTLLEALTRFIYSPDIVNLLYILFMIQSSVSSNFLLI